MSKRRRFGLLTSLVVLAALIFVAYAAWRVHQVQQDLTAAQSDALSLESSLRTGDQPGVDSSSAALRADSRSASKHTGGATWSVLSHVPVFGDDARGIRTLSTVLTSLSGPGLQPLITASKQLDSLVPHDGQIPLAQVTALQAPVAQGAATLGAADRSLSAQDSSGYVSALRTKYDSFTDDIARASHALDVADTALKVMPQLLGADGPRNYLLVVQNNAEIRATGGLPGSISELHVARGRITLTRQAAGNSLNTAKPVLPLTPAEQRIYGETFGEYLVDADATPDFPRAAQLMSAHWSRRFGPVDGVLSVDPVALSYILGAIGPVQVGDVSLTQDNAVEELLHEVYVRYPDPASQDRFFATAAQAIFDRVTSGVGSPRQVITALARATDEHRVYLVATDPGVRSVLAGTEIEGALVTDPKAPPQVGVYLDDATGAKMSYYLRYDVGVQALSCSGAGSQSLLGAATLRSDAPADAATSLPRYVTGGGAFGTLAGDQVVAVRLYGPVGGTISGVTLGGQKVDSQTMATQDGRPVVTTFVSLSPGQQASVQWRMTTGPVQTGDVDVSVTPGVTVGSPSSTSPSAC